MNGTPHGSPYCSQYSLSLPGELRCLFPAHRLIPPSELLPDLLLEAAVLFLSPVSGASHRVALYCSSAYISYFIPLVGSPIQFAPSCYIPSFPPAQALPIWQIYLPFAPYVSLALQLLGDWSSWVGESSWFAGGLSSGERNSVCEQLWMSNGACIINCNITCNM